MEALVFDKKQARAIGMLVTAPSEVLGWWHSAVTKQGARAQILTLGVTLHLFLFSASVF